MQPTFKVVLLGEAGVGKSSIFIRIKDSMFSENPDTVTVGIESCTKLVTCGNCTVKLCLWDTAGVERFRTLTRNYYRNTHAALLTYSLDNPASLLLLSKWADDINYYSQTAATFLLGNKADLGHDVDKDVIKDFALHHQCEGAFFVSAKTGEGVEHALHVLAEKLVELYDKSSKSAAETRSWLTDTSQSNSSSKQTSMCCS